MYRSSLVCLCLFLSGCTNAHFPLVDNAHGGAEYDKWDDAAVIDDITRSSFTYRVALCGHLYFWMKFDRPSGFNTLMVGGLVPVIERFAETRLAVAVIGPGLPGEGATQDEITAFCDSSPVGRLCKGYDDLPEDLKIAHSEMQDSLGVTDLGVIAVPGVEDLTNCDFGEDPLTLDVTGSLYKSSTGGDDVEFGVYTDWNRSHCFYHEEFGGSDMWIVQDKLIELAGEGEYYLVFWSPGDNSLGEPLTPSKFGAVFGDKGQSEDFSGDTVFAGECSLPAQDFYEQDCHGYERPLIPSLIDSAITSIIGDKCAFYINFIYLFWGGAPCEPSYAATVPNVYTCGDEEPLKACTGLCHNHGICPADESIGPFNTTECTSTVDDEGFPKCGETCARLTCGVDQNNTVYGPIGPACFDECRDECDFLDTFFCTEVCGMPSPECVGEYEEEH